MKKVAVYLLVAVLLAIPVTSFAKVSTEARLEQLEQEINDLKKEQKKQKKHTIQTKFPVELYGFVSAQFFGSDSQTVMYTNATANTVAAQSAAADEKAAGAAPNDAWFGATAQNSRLGLKWTGSKVGKTTMIGGKLETDFLNPSGGMSPQLRMRLYYLRLYGKRWELSAGQRWDVFSPLNTKTLSFGSNLWFQGNLGFRRPQVRFVYNVPFADINNVAITAAVTNPGNADLLVNPGIDTGYPYGQVAVAYTRELNHGKLFIGTSGIFGAKRNITTNKRDSVLGIAGSLHIPLHPFFKFSGEFQYGKNMGDFLTYAGTTRNAKSTDVWMQVSSRWTKWFETNIGYGLDYVQHQRVAVAGGLRKNQNIFANVKFYPVKAFCVGLEYNNIMTTYRTNGMSKAHVGFANLIYSF